MSVWWPGFRRFGMAVLLALALGTGTFGLLQFANAGQDGDGGPVLPESLSLPPLLPGDRVSYAVHGNPGWTSEEELPILDWNFTLTYVERGLRPDGQGHLVVADVFLVEDDVANGRREDGALIPLVEETWLWPNGTLLANVRMAGGGIHKIGHNLNDELTCKGASSCGIIWSRYTDTAQPYTAIPCGVLNTMQGRTVVLENATIPIPACDRSQFHFFLGNATVDRAAGQSAVRFNEGYTDRDGPPWGWGNHKLWFTPDLPYPVRMEDSNKVGARVYKISGFTRGSDAAIESSGQTDLAWGHGPREAWGIDPEGPFPFPLSKAWEQAKANPDGPLKPFLDAHPGAAVVEASFGHDSYDGPAFDSFLGDRMQAVSWTWGITVAEERKGLFFTFSKTYTNRTFDTPAGPVAYPSGLVPYQEPAFEYEFGDHPTERHVTLLASPSRLPTPESLWARWRPYAEQDGILDLAPGYGFSLLGLCDHEGPVYWAGSNPDSYVETRQGSIYNNRTQNRVCFDEDGRTLESQTQALAAAPRTAPAAPPPWAETRTEASAFQLTPRVGWIGPAAGAASGAGLGVAALYYFWPALKHGLVGLFSRHAPERAPAQVTRRRILDLVRQSPGIHYRGIVRELGISKSSAEHHLAILEREGQVKSLATPQQVLFFPANAPRAVPASSVDRLLAAMTQPATIGGLADATGLSASTVSYHVGRLVQSGRARRDGNLVVRVT